MGLVRDMLSVEVEGRIGIVRVVSTAAKMRQETERAKIEARAKKKREEEEKKKEKVEQQTNQKEQEQEQEGKQSQQPSRHTVSSNQQTTAGGKISGDQIERQRQGKKERRNVGVIESQKSEEVLQQKGGITG